MNYQKVYDQLVEKCKPRGLDKSKLEGYFEKHHIIPKCLGGSNKKENFVLFTPREHFVAHKLLWKANPENYSLMWAYARTVNSHKGVINSREIEKAKIVKAQYMSTREVSDETKQKISQSLMGHKRTQESIEKSRQGATGQKRSQETKDKISQKRQELIASGWTVPQEARDKIGDFFRGRPISEEHKAKLSKAFKGREIPENVRKATSEYQKSLRPWEKSAAKARPARAKVWRDASESYQIWLEHECPAAYSFSRIMSDLHSTNYPTYHFDKLVEMFKEGWIPEQDSQWLSYKNSEVTIE